MVKSLIRSFMTSGISNVSDKQRTDPIPSIEDLATPEIDVNYWGDSFKEAQFLERQYSVPITQGLFMSLLHDILIEIARLNEEEI